MISGKAKLAGVMGWPVAHSLSPNMQNHWLAQLGIDAAYVPLSVPPEHLSAAFQLLPDIGFAGWNVTVPHKEAALLLVDSVDNAARAIGAVNTVVVRDGALIGMNTDALGFINNLKEKAGDLQPYKKTALVLGAGGAARAVVWALAQEGFQEILIANRSQARAVHLAESLGGPITVMSWDDVEKRISDATLIVNTTTLGMEGQPPLEINTSTLSPHTLVTDTIYRPLYTPLLRDAQARGCKTVTGLGMLVQQGMVGFEQWFGQSPDAAHTEAFLLS